MLYSNSTHLLRLTSQAQALPRLDSKNEPTQYSV